MSINQCLRFHLMVTKMKATIALQMYVWITALRQTNRGTWCFPIQHRQRQSPRRMPCHRSVPQSRLANRLDLRVTLISKYQNGVRTDRAEPMAKHTRSSHPQGTYPCHPVFQRHRHCQKTARTNTASKTAPILLTCPSLKRSRW